MSIILPRRFAQQPQHRAATDHNIKLLFNPSIGGLENNSGLFWTPGGGVSTVSSTRGRAFNFPGGGSKYSYTGYPSLEGYGTLFAFLPEVGAPSSFGHIYLGSNTPVVQAFQVSNTGGIWIGSTQHGEIDETLWFNTTNRSIVFVTGPSSAQIKLFIDGKTALSSGVSAGQQWVSGSKSISLGAYPTGSNWDFRGKMLIAGWSSRLWSESDARTFHDNPFSVYKPRTRRLWGVPAAAGSSHNLTVSNAVQTNSATPSVITQIHALAVQSPAQGNIAASTAIAITQTLAGANATQSNIAQAGAISQGAGFLADSLDQGNVLVAGAIAQSHALIGGTGAQGNAASAGAITQSHSLTISNAVQANPASVGGIALDGDINLTVQASVQSNSFFTDPIHQTHILVISATAQGNSTEAVTVTQVHPLTAAQLAQVNSVSTGPVFVEGQLAVDEPLQANSLSAGAITTIQTLVIGGFAQDNRMSSGAVSPGAIFEAAAAAGTELRERIKKPGIPSDAPRWLRTTIEIILGRRNNKIEIPQHQEITFSATPTQDECKALYDYTSSVRNSLEQLINRLDS